MGRLFAAPGRTRPRRPPPSKGLSAPGGVPTTLMRLNAFTILLAFALIAPALAGCVDDSESPGAFTQPPQGNGSTPPTDPVPIDPVGNETPDPVVPEPPTPGWARLNASAPMGAPAGAVVPAIEHPASLAAQVTFVTTVGNITVEVYPTKVPITAGNFLHLARSGAYDNTTFHRVIKGFMVQGGDPNSRDDDPSNDGLGGPGYVIPDEFHRDLRHDAEGVLSMANAGPGTGGSQFFITLAPTKWLDLRHSVFGKVVSNMSVVRAMGNATMMNGTKETPEVPVRILQTLVVEPKEAALTALDPTPFIHLATADKKAVVSRPVHFAVAVTNVGPVAGVFTLGGSAPAGWRVLVEERFATLPVPAGDGRMLILNITVPPTASLGTYPFTVSVAPVDAPDRAVHVNGSVEVVPEFGPFVRWDDKIKVRFAGFTDSGELFTTNSNRFAQDGGVLTHMNYVPRNYTENPWNMTSGTGGPVTGVGKGVVGAREGEWVVFRIPPGEDTYGSDRGPQSNRNLWDFQFRDLVYEIEIVES